MSKAMQTGLGLGALALILIVLALAFGSRKDICADTVRGYKEKVGSSVSVIRSGFDSLKGSLGTDSSYEVPELSNLDVGSYQALQRCDTSCRVLSQCLRFVFFSAPSVACPEEYKDLKETQANAEIVLGRLAGVAKQVDEVKAQVPEVQRARSEVAELEKSPGATGSRLAIARAKQSEVDQDLTKRLKLLSASVAALRVQATK